MNPLQYPLSKHRHGGMGFGLTRISPASVDPVDAVWFAVVLLFGKGYGISARSPGQGGARSLRINRQRIRTSSIEKKILEAEEEFNSSYWPEAFSVALFVRRFVLLGSLHERFEVLCKYVFEHFHGSFCGTRAKPGGSCAFPLVRVSSRKDHSMVNYVAR
jgi:hypothetical protein